MKNFAIKNICINYDEIQNEWRNLSKRQIKRAVYKFVYGELGIEYLKKVVSENKHIDVYWHYGWNAPVVFVPPIKGYCDIMYDITKELEAHLNVIESKGAMFDIVYEE